MGYLHGQMEYKKFKKGERLTYREAVLANCYHCNGLNEGGEDCRGKSCPLYQHMPYNENKRKGS